MVPNPSKHPGLVPNPSQHPAFLFVCRTTAIYSIVVLCAIRMLEFPVSLCSARLKMLEFPVSVHLMLRNALFSGIFVFCRCKRTGNPAFLCWSFQHFCPGPLPPNFYENKQQTRRPTQNPEPRNYLITPEKSMSIN